MDYMRLFDAEHITLTSRSHIKHIKIDMWTHKPMVLGSNPSLAIFFVFLSLVRLFMRVRQ